MVKGSVFLILYFCFLTFSLYGDDISVQAEIDQSGGVWENQPLKGIISITHDEKDKVDESSFKMDNAPLSVEFSREVRFSQTSPLVLSYYQFALDGKPRGLQILPSISVKVGDKRYASSPSTYQVGELAVPPQAPDGGQKKRILKLEAGIEGPAEIYPGTRFKVVYRYIFNDDIELTKESLPALEGTGFTKIGAQEANDSQQGSYSIRAISQVLEAVKPGVFKFDGASIEGYAYRNDPFGGHYYLKPALQAGTVPLEITVLPFPEKGKLASFNGAVGSFSKFSVHLLSPAKISVGDKIVLSAQITGTGMGNVPLPDLCCQPGMSGVFQLSDLPPSEKKTENSKTFTVEMRPLIPGIKMIPSLEFSYFVPTSRTYATLKSNPIPITVLPLPEVQEKKKEEPQPEEEKVEWRKEKNELKPIEVFTIEPMNSSDLNNRFFGSWWVFWILLLGPLLLLLQHLLKEYLSEQKKRITQKTSREIFNSTLEAGTKSPYFFQMLTKSFMLRLEELGLIKDSEIDPEKLPATGQTGLVRSFLLKLDEERFTGQQKVDEQQLVQEAKEQFEKLK